MAAVGRDRPEEPVRPRSVEDPAHEPAVVVGTGEPVDHRRHLHDHVGREQPLEPLDVGRLEGPHVPLDPGALLGPVRLAGPVRLGAHRPQAGPGPLEGAVDRAHGGAEDLGRLGGREGEDVAEDEGGAVGGPTGAGGPRRTPDASCCRRSPLRPDRSCPPTSRARAVARRPVRPGRAGRGDPTRPPGPMAAPDGRGPPGRSGRRCWRCGTARCARSLRVSSYWSRARQARR